MHSAKRSDFCWPAAWLAFFAWAGLNLSLDDPGRGQAVLNLVASFHAFEPLRILLLPGLYFLFWKAAGAKTEGRRGVRILLACFLAANMVLGYAFEKSDSWDMLLGLRNGQTLKACAVFAAWSAVLYGALKVMYVLLDRAAARRPAPAAVSPDGFHPLQRYARLLSQRPFVTAFLTLFLFFLPHFFTAYPARFMGDTRSMIVQAYSQLGTTAVTYPTPEMVIRPGVYINQHHPVVYTLLLHACLQVGDWLFHSFNKGIFLMCMGQSLVILAAFAYALSVLQARGVRIRTLMLILAYILFQPQIRNFLFMATKEGLYTAGFVTWMAGYFMMRSGGRRRDFILFCLGGLGVLLFRNEGKYVLLLSGVVMAWADRDNRKKLICFSTAMAMVAAGLNWVLWPALGYTKGCVQEALSVPLQQTARVVRDHPEDITGPERAAIDAVLHYSDLADDYNPETADPVKDLYRLDATSGELIGYLRAWAHLVLRHPGTCLQATYENYYQYLYPDSLRIWYDTYDWSARMCEITNLDIRPLGKAFALPEWNKKFRFIGDSLVEAGLFQLPPFSLMMTPALFSWGLLALLGWAAGKRKDGAIRARLSLLAPSLLIFLVLFAGPTNAYYSRYMLPLTSFLPFLAAMLTHPGPAAASAADRRSPGKG